MNLLIFVFNTNNLPLFLNELTRKNVDYQPSMFFSCAQSIERHHMCQLDAHLIIIFRLNFNLTHCILSLSCLVSLKLYKNDAKKRIDLSINALTHLVECTVIAFNYRSSFES